MKPVMYLCLNKGLGMSTGKAAAQASHAAVEAYKISRPELIEAWELGGHYTKLVFQADDANQLADMAFYLEERGFEVKSIVDEGRTEVRPFSATAFGVEIVDKDDPHTKATFESFRLYKDPKPEPPEKFARRVLASAGLSLLANPK